MNKLWDMFSTLNWRLLIYITIFSNALNNLIWLSQLNACSYRWMFKTNVYRVLLYNTGAAYQMLTIQYNFFYNTQGKKY